MIEEQLKAYILENLTIDLELNRWDEVLIAKLLWEGETFNRAELVIPSNWNASYC